MKPSDRETANADFLGGSFVVIPHDLMARYAELGLSSDEFVVLLQILTASQVGRQDFVSPQELSSLCKMSVHMVSEVIRNLLSRGYLSIGERLDDTGTHSNYYDLKPLWTRLRGRDPLQSPVREWRKDTVSLFEEEFGRPLSGLECEQIREWLERDGLPDWLIHEALREAVLANKYSFKYIDRVLFDWQRNRVRTKQELEVYRQSYRERTKPREEIAAAGSSTRRANTPHRSKNPTTGSQDKDERYSAFYQLFPDS